MLKLKKIAITGGVASGKSTACRFFRELGAYVVDADRIVHSLFDSQTTLSQQIVQALGSDILQNEKISRKLVAKKVFENPALLEVVEKLIHPEVLKRIEEEYAHAATSRKYTAFVVEIPLLFEIRKEELYDLVIAVLADETKAQRRFEEMGFQPGEYARRMRRQMRPEEKAVRADVVLKNNGSLEDLRKQVVNVHQTIQRRYEQDTQ